MNSAFSKHIMVMVALTATERRECRHAPGKQDLEKLSQNWLVVVLRSAVLKFLECLLVASLDSQNSSVPVIGLLTSVCRV